MLQRLGPGGHDHVTVETRNEIARATHRYLRTAVHPSADLVEGATTFDDLYDTADTFDDVYTEIAEALVAAAAKTKSYKRVPKVRKAGAYAKFVKANYSKVKNLPNLKRMAGSAKLWKAAKKQ